MKTFLNRSLFLLSLLTFLFVNKGYSQVKLVKDFNETTSSSFGVNDSKIITGFGDKVLVQYENEVDAWELWVSNGETDGTMLLETLGEDSEYRDFVNVSTEDAIYYIVEIGNSSLIKKLDKASLAISTLYEYSKQASRLTVLQGNLYFTGEVLDDNEDGLWKLNQAEGTAEVIYEFHWNGGIGDLVIWKDKLALIAATSGGDSLFVSDGTKAGTTSFLQISESNRIGSSHYLTGGDEKLYFFYEKSGEPYKLYVTDGTEEGNLALVDLKNYSFFSNPRDYRGIHIHKDHLFFRGQPEGSPSGTYELYISNGTVDGTFLYDFPDSKGRPSYFTTYRDTVYFRADFGDGISTVYKSDGTLEGTGEAIDGFSFGNGLDFGGYHLTTHKDQLFFLAYRSSTGGELWQSEGTTETTSMLEIVPGRDGGEPRSMTSTDNYLFFLGITPDHGRELMVYATEDMSTPVRNIALNTNKWQVSPNPVSELLYLEKSTPINKPFTAKIWTVNGQEVLKTENNRMLDVHTLTKGTYFLEIIEEGVSSFQKVIKQ